MVNRTAPPDQTVPPVDNDLVSTHANEFAADHPDVPASGPPPSGKRMMVLGVIIPVVILALSVGAFVALGTSETEQLPVPGRDRDSLMGMLPSADSAKVKSLDAIGGVLDIHADGNVVPFREIQLAAEVSGQIIEKSPACEAGEYVKQGQLLLKIDPTDYELEIERLERQQQQEYEALRELDQEMSNTNNLIELAEQEVAIQERELKRFEQLGDGFASQAEVDQARRARLQALNSLQTLKNQLALAQRRRARLEAAEQLAATQLKRARVDLQRTEVVSPVDGVIVREDVELNSFVSRGSQLVLIEETGRVEVAVNLKMEQLLWVLDQADASPSPERSLSVAGKAYTLPPTDVTVQYKISGRQETVLEWEGRLQRYDGIGVDPASRTVPVRIVVPKPERVTYARGSDRKAARQAGPSALVRGMFVHVVIHARPQTPLVLVPTLGMLPGNRVIKFTPDDQVIEELKAEIERKIEEEESLNESPSGGGTEPAQQVDASEWVAGRARIVTGVFPIADVTLDSDIDISRYAIAESENVHVGDTVVISPLAGLTLDQPMSVRVAAEDASEKSAAVDE